MKIETALIVCEAVTSNLLKEGDRVLHTAGVRQPVMYEIATIEWDQLYMGDVRLVCTDGSTIVLPDMSEIVRVTAR